MIIKVLDPHVANKIAAGEVVERPASIVKELIENAIDAGATSVTLEIRGGGIESIRVSDNGCGMERDDVKTAFLRHATSKIASSEDLNDILTLGFRGEALASIAAVSRVKMTTRRKDQPEGTEIVLTGGTVDRFSPCGCPDGTDIRVEDLFFNTPARRKFLKRPSQETAYITDTVERLALSHPELSLRFVSDGRTVARTPGDGQLSSCVRALMGSETAAHMIPLSHERGPIRLTGLLGDRETQKANRSSQRLFINGRSVKNDLVSAAVQQAYQGRLNVGKFPTFVLFMELPGNLVDVNVHPTKQEVRFADGLPVFDTVREGVSKALLLNQEIPSLFEGEKKEKEAPTLTVQSSATVLQAPAEKPVTKKYASGATPQERERFYKALRGMAVEEDTGLGDVMLRTLKKEEAAKKAEEKNAAAPRPPEAPAKPEVTPEITSEKTESPVPEAPVIPQAPETPQAAEVPTAADVSEPPKETPKEEPAEEPRQMAMPEAGNGEADYRIAGVLFDTYLIVQMGDDAFLVDQHAAHERLLFEKFYAQKTEAVSQLMLVPRVIKVTPAETAFLEDLLPTLSQLGFEIEPMGFSSFGVKAIPAFLSDSDVPRFLTSLLDESGSLRALRGNDVRWARLARLACKTAVKAGDKLTDKDIRYLLGLIGTEGIPLSCPHGRPIMVRMTRHELEVRFKRVQ